MAILCSLVWTLIRQQDDNDILSFVLWWHYKTSKMGTILCSLVTLIGFQNGNSVLFSGENACMHACMMNETYERMNVWTYERINVWTYERMNVWTYECMNVWMYEAMNVWMYERMKLMNVWMYECMNLWMYGCMNVWMYECMNAWMYECMLCTNVCLCT